MIVARIIAVDCAPHSSRYAATLLFREPVEQREAATIRVQHDRLRSASRAMEPRIHLEKHR